MAARAPRAIRLIAVISAILLARGKAGGRGGILSASMRFAPPAPIGQGHQKVEQK